MTELARHSSENTHTLSLSPRPTNGSITITRKVMRSKLLRKAAEQGDARAQTRLGFMYYNGIGLPDDIIPAHVWWNLAAAKGMVAAERNRLDVENEMTDEQKIEAMKRARELSARLEKK